LLDVVVKANVVVFLWNIAVFIIHDLSDCAHHFFKIQIIL